MSSRQRETGRRQAGGARAAAAAGTSAGATSAPAQSASAPPAPPATAPPPAAPSLADLPTFPPEATRAVNRLLKSAAYFPIFSVANPNSPNRPVPLIPGIPFLSQYLMVAVEVNEELHRFEIEVVEGAGPGGGGLRAAKAVGEPVANVHIRWTPMPDGFEAGPGRYPPPTVLNPFASQRFSMLEGQLTFKDRDGSGFRAFGTGRTFPVSSGGGPRQLRIGAVIDILEGLGKFQGLAGTVVVNGYIAPPNALALNLMVRLMDPTGRLRATSELSPLRAMADPDPGAVFMMFLGEDDPDTPTQPIPGPPGGPPMLGAHVHERLRLVRLGFDVSTPAGLRSQTVEGPLVGRVDATLWFNPFDPRPVAPISTTDGVFTFFDRDGRAFGTINANMVEGRAMKTPLAGTPFGVYRFGGFGPLLGGTGQFAGADGMMSMNSVISFLPRTLSNLYVFRLADPDGRFRAAVGPEWRA